MTAQIPDKYTFENKEYKFVAINKPIGFHPRDYGLEPDAYASDCWRGYWCEYSIRRSRLVLKKLLIYNAHGYYPPFNGIEPSSVDLFGNGGYVPYEVNLEMDYTGRIVIGREFIDEYYIHGGFQRAWAYKEVKELVFDNGIVVEVIDHSDEVKTLRRLYDEDPDSFVGDLLSYDDTPAFLKDDTKLSSDKMRLWWLIP